MNLDNRTDGISDREVGKLLVQAISDKDRKITALKSQVETLRDALLDAEGWMASLPLEPRRQWSVSLHETDVNRIMPLNKVRAALSPQTKETEG